ncbi:MAG: hypothetical protein P8I55_07845 [Crocinitomix sp.]|nr:hypothetical protein [Crocinitomix sp.]
MAKNKHFIVLLVIGMLFLMLFYGKAITNPNGILFNDSGDAIKNYYTYAYHINNDSSYTNFEGMNYPYGEHYLYTDCHPILANTFKFLGDELPFLKTHSIGVLNFFMLFSMLLTFIVVYFVLQEFSLNKWFCVAFSIAITLLSPQLFRLEGHLALSYSFAIPLSWFLLIRALKTPKKGVYILLFLNTVFWLFIHAYLGMIILAFLVAFLFSKVLLDQERKQKLIKYSVLLIVLLVPLLTFYSYAKLSDTHTDRTDNPSGFFLYNAELDDVFLPNHPPLKPVFDLISGNTIKQEWEAWSYVGLATTILFVAFIVTLFLWGFNKNKRKKLSLYFSDSYLNASLLAAFLVLLFAMAFPFRLFPDLLDVFPILKQFRATGRFAWPFYFVALVFAAYVFQKIYANLSRKKGLVFITAVITLTIIEGLYYHIELSKKIVEQPNVFKKELLKDEYIEALNTIDENKFQAIITLPFYHQGSETFSRTINDNAVRSSIIFSYHTKLPLVNANLTRVSVNESKNIVQLISPSYYRKELQNDLKSAKSFLIVKVNEELSKYENDLYKKATSVYKRNNIELLAITPQVLFENTGEIEKQKFELLKDSLSQNQGFYVSDANSFVYYNNYENMPSEFCFRGKGAYEGVKKGKNIFAEFEPNTFTNEKEYHISMWMHNGEKDALNLWLRLIVEEYDEANEEWFSTTLLPEYSEVIYGDWSLVEGTFKIKDANNKVYIVSKGKDNSKAHLYADDLLIREVSNAVYKLEDGNLFYNNHEIVAL